MARVPEHRDQALHDLRQLTEDPKDNEAAHRGLAWDDIRQKRFDVAADELDKATELNPRDPWIWYYRSALKYQKAQATRQEMQGLANMMQDLRAVADWYPELADAYNMLAVARVEGGGFASALEAQRMATALAPRNLEYQFNLGQIYVAGKKLGSGAGCVYAVEGGPGSGGGSGGEAAIGRLRDAPEIWSASATSRGKRSTGGRGQHSFGRDERACGGCEFRGR